MSKEISPTLLALARQRVARGVTWLETRAKHDRRFVGWRLQLMSIYGGRIFSHVRMEFNTNDPISLACKEAPELADPSDGRVKWMTTARAFGFFSTFGAKKAVYLGFWEGNRYGDHARADVMDYCAALNQAWSEALGEYRTRVAPRHYIPRRSAA